MAAKLQQQRRKKTSVQILGDIREEFHRVFHSRVSSRLFVNTNAIIILSGRMVTVRGRNTSNDRENRGRIRMAISLQRRIAALRRTNAKDARVMRYYAPPLYLIGATEQLSELAEVAKVMDYLREPTVLDCGPVGRANTMTQCIAINEHVPLATCQHVTIVTSRYHVPRVARTADRWLPGAMRFTVIGAPQSNRGSDLQAIVEQEERRILEYGQSGDLNITPRRSGMIWDDTIDRKT